MEKCFYAYPSEPIALVETIEKAIKKIQQKKIVDVRGWKSVSITGNFIINEICKEINNCSVFLCDLTYINSNVLFELGYAIAKNKKVWITIDTSIKNATKNYDKLRLLTTVGYIDYSNYQQLVDSFLEDEPFNNTADTIFNSSISHLIDSQEKYQLLYLKSVIDTSASIELSNRIIESAIDVVIDDPVEVSTQPLSWYVQKVTSSLGVITHFVSDEHRESRIHNAKCAFLSGLAHGFGKNLLMLAHSPYKTPIDYKDFLKVHSTAKECSDYINNWLIPIEVQYMKMQRQGINKGKKLHKNPLQQLYIGDYIAENEHEELMEYFVETSVYTEALNANQCIIVGRKGTGKSANLYKIENELMKDKRNHTCVIKPISYELEGILELLKKSLPVSEQGYIVESFWKYLIYTELAKSIYNKFLFQPGYINKTKDEEVLDDFISQNKDIIVQEFSVKLQNIITKLCGIPTDGSIQQQRVKVSEILHTSIISQLRVLLGNVLKDKNKVCILMDNLDKAWNKREDVNILCDLLYGLLSVSRRITEEFSGEGGRWKKVNLALIIFIRNDIFNYIMKNSRERDKLPHNRITWEPEMLARIIEERIFHSTSREENIWEKYFCATVQGINTRDYILESIVPRPRDIVYFCKNMIWEAINRGHIIIEEEDILAAENKYSEYVLNTLIVENGVTLSEIENILYEFAGSKEILQEFELYDIFKNAKIPREKYPVALEHLFDLSFLGKETQTGTFRFLYDDKDRHIIDVLSKKLPEKRFKINKPFHRYLEIKNYS